ETSLAKRKAYLEQLLPLLPAERPEQGRVSPLDATWKDWLGRTDELPPDFDSMPSIPFLPDLLVIDEGGKNIPITNTRQWLKKREWMNKEIKHWLTGTFPPPPNNMQSKIISERKSGNVTLRSVELRFGPEHKAKLTVELMIPPGEGPFPIFMTQWNHRGWALIAVRRGYIGCVYAGADVKDDTESYADIWYPKYDFTRLMRRAWGAHRTIDYLYTLPFVDKGKIGLTGHSRNGKQSLMAAAFDERITAVIPSSGGTGSEDPWRYTSDKFDNETILDITTNFPHWFHPRLRFFIGREHKLPVDQNHLMGLVAPRGLMLSSAITESQGNPWGIEQLYHSVKGVYKFLGAEDKLGIRLRDGLHATAARDIEAYLDFFDYVFCRNNIKPENHLFYDYTFSKWLGLSGEKINPLDYPEKGIADILTNKDGNIIATSQAFEQKKKECIERIRWGFGEEPPGTVNLGPKTIPKRQRDDYLASVIPRPEAGEKMGKIIISPYASFGDYLTGYLYYPLNAEGKPKNKNLPLVIFLHEYDYSTGFARRIQPFFEDLVEEGFAVFTFDMIGFGTRIEEGTLFYERYLHWSKLGKMVADVKSAVDAFVNMDFIDSGRIYTFGYSLGGTVGLYSAALDDRIAGSASVCGFTPMRLATLDKGIEGIKAHSHLHGLLPRLGFFVGSENRIPYDFHEILSCIAPKPLLVIAPQIDRDAYFPDVKACADEVNKVYELYGEKA
ncbi:alpha/beta fold hydrolase, partial [candidate division KSB1 bacterium]